MSGIVQHTGEIAYDLVVIGAAPKNVFQKYFDPTCMSVRAYSIIESIEPPVLVVIGRRTTLRRILLCTGGTEHIEKAIAFTGKIAQAANAIVDLVHVLPETPAIYSILSNLRRTSISCSNRNRCLAERCGTRKSCWSSWACLARFGCDRGRWCRN